MITFRGHFDGSVIFPDEPVELDTGSSYVVMVNSVAENNSKHLLTVGEMLDAGLLGAWKDRTDIGDSRQFARAIRERNQRRIVDASDRH